MRGGRANPALTSLPFAEPTDGQVETADSWLAPLVNERLLEADRAFRTVAAHDGFSGAEFEALWRPRTFRSARDPPLEVPARWARHPEGRETRSRPPCRPTGWADGAAARWPQ